MKYKLLFLFIIIYNISISQNQVAKYKFWFINNEAKKDLKEKLVSKNPKSIAIYNKFIKNSKPAYGSLIFNDVRSIYQLNNTLSVGNKQKFDFIYNRAGGDDVYYNGSKKFFKTNVSGEESYIYMDKIEWQIKPAKKIINGIQCQLATYNKNKNKVVEVWFSLEHQVPFGPQYYYGLPGLIISIKDKPFLIEIIEIKTINESIKEFPKNIKIITSEEFKRQNNFDDIFGN